MHTGLGKISVPRGSSSHTSRIEWPDAHSGQLRRVREPVNRCKSGLQGKIADVFHGCSRHAESRNELQGFRVLLATGRADAWQEQPFRLEYHDDGTKHCYTPDILVIWGAHREIVEIKEDAEASLPANQERFAVLRALFAEHGYQFRLWLRSEICAEPRLTNASLVLRYRCVSMSATESENIRRAFSSIPVLPLRTLVGAGGITAQSVLRTVLDGLLHINWWEPLTLDSRISCLPIGPQIWPTPPGTTTTLISARRPDGTMRS
jgi:hypothetical protein